MRFLKLGGHAIPAWIIATILISAIGMTVLAYNLWPSFTTTLEVKEPLSILNYPSGFILYPGETTVFNVTVENSGPMNYSAVLDFTLNDSGYQAEYVSFSNVVYNVTLGQQDLSAWMTVATNAPATTVTMSVNLVRLGTGVAGTPSGGLVGYWKFDEGNGTSTIDSSGNGNSGILIGSPIWTVGVSGYALTFDGTNYVDCGNAASLHVQSYTLATWIKPSALYDSEHRIMSNGGFGGGEFTGAVDFLIDVNGRLVILNQDGYGQDVCRSQSASLFTVGSWSFVAATYDATTGSVKLYVNGTAVSTTTATLRAPNPNPNWNMHIGVTGGPNLYKYFQGSMDEVQIYDRALMPAEILSLY